ncbi:serine/arginine repetitive matrix protein 2 isoform X1 [Diachasmimorpha longicaudata]|uniref:serine/arginine repetitive matrix protein 2 isoform X1 n=1 Tax=Diachasmimorpha longicaudata TaxID=58733 RepID=UPI0030B8C677
MEVISTRRYEARPPVSAIHSGLLYDPKSKVATVKEEEWETRKKKEITTTRQIETRVKRQVVLEDGEVVKDSGPLVTTNTTEDVEQQEHTTQERKTNGDEPKKLDWEAPTTAAGPVVQKELNETIVRSREETEELLETEDRRQFGDITDEAYQQAVRNNRGDLRLALAESSRQVAVNTGPRIVQHKTKSNKVIDTEKTLERKEFKPDGAIVTETKKSVEHEEIGDVEAPEGVGDEPVETRKESSQRFLKQREEDVVDYVAGGERIGRDMKFIAEKTEGERIGDWPPPPDRMRTVRLPKPGDPAPLDRKDALTKKPLDPEEEDEARKFETSKWLENHFGSESRSSQGSIEPDGPPIQTTTNTSFINVTMKSCTPRDRDYKSASNTSQVRTSIRANGRESASPSGYFHGITEWSERYQGSGDKQNHNSSVSTASPKHYVVESTISVRPETVTYTKNYETSTRKHHETHRRSSPPSPPVRRRVREQISEKMSRRLEEKTSYPEPRPQASPSPVNVITRTWQTRNQDWSETPEQPEVRHYAPAPKSRSPSPVIKIPPHREKKENIRPTSRSGSPRGTSKSRIGESFRKLVGKLRSASSERKNKKNGDSKSQLTQTDDSSTYLQYNVIDKNIPEIGVDQVDGIEEKPPERPPRSPRVTTPTTQTIKVTRSNGHSGNNHNGSHKYYVSEESYSSRNAYEREPLQESRHSRTTTRHHERSQKSPRTISDYDYRLESSTLGRLSKSTSRLTNDYDREDPYPGIQTLPRKLHSSTHNKQTSMHTRRSTSKQIPVTQTARPSQGRNYGSMINISIKNVKSPQGSRSYSPVQGHIQPPMKPERTYKSSLLRSKSFNVEANNGDRYPEKVPYKSNSQLNRLDETQPLKSPGILASISRSNRDLFKYECY